MLVIHQVYTVRYYVRTVLFCDSFSGNETVHLSPKLKKPSNSFESLHIYVRNDQLLYTSKIETRPVYVKSSKAAINW